MKDRWEKSKKIYKSLDIPAQMVMHEEIGHKTTPKIKKDIVEFFRFNAGK